MTQPIFVTGAAGFIGSHIAAALQGAGHAVLGVDNFDPFYARAIKDRNVAAVRKAGGSFELVEMDIADAGAVDALVARVRPQAVVHLAALAGVRPSMERPADFNRVNVMGTENLFVAGRKHGVTRWVVASSSSVYGPRAQRPFREDEPHPEPMSPYGATKLIIERNAQPYTKLSGFRTALLRFFTVYGPRQRPDLAIHKFARLMQQGQPVEIYGDGTALRDFTYIDDIVQGVRKALDWTATGGPACEVFNLGESRTVTVNQMIDTIETALGAKAVRRYGPPHPGDMPNTHADISKARRVLGYAPATDFPEGVARFVEWLRGEPPAGKAQ